MSSTLNWAFGFAKHIAQRTRKKGQRPLRLWRGMEGDRREVSLSLKCPVIMSQASLVKQISENIPSVPEFRLLHEVVKQPFQPYAERHQKDALKEIVSVLGKKGFVRMFRCQADP